MNNGQLRVWRHTITLAVLFSLIFIYGCGASKPKPQDYDQVLDSETVVMLDRTSTSQLSKQKEWVEEKNGFMEPHIILRNLSGNTIYIEIRTYFKDEYGGTIETATDTWDPVTINPHQDYHYHRMCTKKNGVGYQFHIRMGKESH
ncbi:MAG: hypothetical protein MIO92_08010 [Methanosarcinaceae archaeon]|nr:hypothetical protein [Methanosarcinaceae archaeon]